MRPFRLLLSFITVFVLLTLTLYINEPSSSHNIRSANPTPKKHGAVHALFSWSSPSALFPPSAIISLTDDNETFFLARPAAFGPLLPNRGLNGQLWAGSAFADDALSDHGFSVADFDGELGCSDIPGWADDSRTSRSAGSDNSKSRSKGGKSKNRRGGSGSRIQDDGTDDHNRGKTTRSTSARGGTNADIQSLQEGAEIAGKVVLLSRGGCGFLDKVKWSERRGATALIVGDNVRGGPLVTMYAHGDTSNVTIPALFTSHTTAHLLASLIDSTGTFSKRPSKAVKDGSRPKGHTVSTTSKPSLPTFTHVASKPKQTSKAKHHDIPVSSALSAVPLHQSHSQGFFASMFRLWGYGTGASFSGVEPQGTHKSTQDDDFVIGVHDWRDPVHQSKPTDRAQHGRTAKDGKARIVDDKPKGGSIMPGSGEYSKPIPAGAQTADLEDHDPASDREKPSTSHGWLASFFGASDESDDEPTQTMPTNVSDQMEQPSPTPIPDDPEEPEEPHHEGLWVTLTPGSMASSPFFDTLLVLVISPLVTLTVVYALLLLRSRIRRRRWRAPKSVVERLPIRTYHTIPSENSSPSASTLVATTPPSPTTPLLATAPRPLTTSRPRPRSRTTSEVPASSSYEHRQRQRDASPDSEKREAGLAEWRRRYGGRQKECVVCLEEYVDGVSQVMSLPCGHEFHAECITPWLTTRRRTCPICKGDVVRSLARTQSTRAHTHSPSRSPSTSSLLSPDDVQNTAATRRNDDPSALRPMSPDASADDLYALDENEDVERGAVWDDDDADQEQADARQRRPSRRAEGDHGPPGLVQGLLAEVRVLRNDVVERWREWGRSGAADTAHRGEGRDR